jgi:hypothetical protein
MLVVVSGRLWDMLCFGRNFSVALCRQYIRSCLLGYSQIDSMGRLFSETVISGSPCGARNSLCITKKLLAQGRNLLLWLFTRIMINTVKINLANPGGPALKGVGLRSLTCLDCAFQSRQGHGYLSPTNVAYRTVRGLCDGPIPSPGESSRMCVCVCVCVCHWEWSGATKTLYTYNE